MSPEEIKGYSDLVIGLVGAGGISSILLAVIGAITKRKEQQSAPVPPSIGVGGMQAIGGMMAAEGHVSQMLDRMTAAQARGFETIERELHRIADRLSDDHRSTMKRLAEVEDDLGEALRRVEKGRGD